MTRLHGQFISADEDIFEVFVVSTRPLFDLGDTILEMSKAQEDRHGMKLVIKIVLPSIGNLFKQVHHEPSRHGSILLGYLCTCIQIGVLQE